MNLEEILTRLRTIKPRLQREFDVVELGVFGSFARGDNRPESAIDLLVAFSITPDLFKFMDLEDVIAESLEHPIRLVRKEGIRQEFHGNVGQEIIPI
jgi:uncharacterized protein